MKKKIFVLGLCVLLLGGCGKNIPELKDGEEAVVTFKDGAISADDLYTELKDSMGLEALINLIDKNILEQEYDDQLEAAKSNAEATIQSYITSYGSEEDFLNALMQYTKYTTVDAYQNYLYLSYLQNLAIEDYAKEQISDKEVKKYYKEETKSDIAVSHILITPEVTDKMTADEKTAAETAALNEAKEVIAKLKDSKNVEETFGQLAKEHSDDASSNTNNGSLGYINVDTLGADYTNVVTKAYELKDGKYTTTPVKSTIGYHIVLRTDTKEKAKLEDVEDSIKETLAKELINNDRSVVVKALQEIRKEYGVEIKDSELKTQYANYIQNALNQIKKANEKAE